MSDDQNKWDAEYSDPKLLSKSLDPQEDVVRFFKWLTKYGDYELEGRQVLDLGCGIGRNLLFPAVNFETGGVGYDISEEAIKEAKENARTLGYEDNLQFQVHHIGEPYPLLDNSMDIVLDVTSSHTLTPEERNTYLAEVQRVLKPGGYLFVRTLCRDGDKNAQNLQDMFCGEYYDTYVHPDLGVTERIFREEDFRELYGLYFDSIEVEKKKGYQRWGGQSYKRRYLVAYLQNTQ